MRLPESQRVPRLISLLLAFSLTAVACGGGETTSDSASNDAEADASAVEAEGGVESDSAQPASDAEPASDAGSDSDAEPASDEESSDDGAAAENLFPDVEVVNVSDGSALNLAAELGGGDTPVLLWFWAPH